MVLLPSDGVFYFFSRYKKDMCKGMMCMKRKCFNGNKLVEGPSTSKFLKKNCSLENWTPWTKCLSPPYCLPIIDCSYFTFFINKFIFPKIPFRVTHMYIYTIQIDKNRWRKERIKNMSGMATPSMWPLVMGVFYLINNCSWRWFLSTNQIYFAKPRRRKKILCFILDKNGIPELKFIISFHDWMGSW